MGRLLLKSHQLMDSNTQQQRSLGVTSRVSLYEVAIKSKEWPLELAFHTHRGGRPLCPSIITRNIATLIAANLHPLGAPGIWSGNLISTTLILSIPITTHEDGCPTATQTYTRINRILRKLIPLGNMRSSHRNKSHDSPRATASTYSQMRKSYGRSPTSGTKSPTLSKNQSSISASFYKRTPLNTSIPLHSHFPSQISDPHF